MFKWNRKKVVLDELQVSVLCELIEQYIADTDIQENKRFFRRILTALSAAA